MTETPDPWLAAIAPERIARALNGFSLELTDGWSFARLTAAIQGVANAGRDLVQLGPARQSDRDARLELESLALRARALLDDLEAPGNSAFHAVIMRGALATEKATGSFGYRTDDYRRDFTEPLRKIADLLSMSAEDVRTRPRQKPRWVEKEANAMRVRFALALADVFTVAFDTSAAADNWHLEYYDRQQPWPDFYQRIYAELFGQTTGLNLTEVLQAAARIRAGNGRIEDLGSHSLSFPPRVAS